MKKIILTLILLTVSMSCSTPGTISEDLTQEEKKQLLKDMAVHEDDQLSVRQVKYDCHTLATTRPGSAYYRIIPDLYEKKLHCDTMSPELVTMITMSMQSLLSNEDEEHSQISLFIPQHGQTFILNWAKLVKDSELGKNPRAGNLNPLIEKMLMQEGALAPMRPLFEAIGYQPTKVRFEKLGWFAPRQLEELEKELLAMGFSDSNKLSVPEGILIHLQKTK
jgi:hypothetical protein